MDDIFTVTLFTSPAQKRGPYPTAHQAIGIAVALGVANACWSIVWKNGDSVYRTYDKGVRMESALPEDLTDNV